FNVADPATLGPLTLSLLRDDGAIVYINGAEVFRSNMAAGTVTSATFASAQAGPVDEARYYSTSVANSALVAGTNTIAVEVHQFPTSNADMSFNLTLVAGDPAPFMSDGGAGTANWSAATNWVKDLP